MGHADDGGGTVIAFCESPSFSLPRFGNGCLPLAILVSQTKYRLFSFLAKHTRYDTPFVRLTLYTRGFTISFGHRRIG
jgi:hypothetical protein